VGWLLGGEADLRYRPDGKPEVNGGFAVSSSHGAGVTFTVASTASGTAVACDVEVASERSEEDWAGLLGPAGLDLARLIAHESDESLSVAGTRVWGAFETLSKNGRARADLVLDGGARSDRWVLLRSGAARIATFPTLLNGKRDPVVFTMLTEGGE
jgi:enediyne polyketide synthase